LFLIKNFIDNNDETQHNTNITKFIAVTVVSKAVAQRINGSINMALSPFHLAIPVYDLATCRAFYGETFSLSEGRSSAQWVDFDFYGHQLVIHEHPKTATQDSAHTNPVDGHDVPVPHFGIVLGWDEWEQLAARLKSFNTHFVIEPYIRFQGQVGEQATMFLLDPCGNALEFKAFKDIGQLFAR